MSNPTTSAAPAPQAKQPAGLPPALQLTPSLETILQSFAQSNESDRNPELLRTIVLAKAAEDQRLARLSALMQTQVAYFLHVAQLQQQQNPAYLATAANPEASTSSKTCDIATSPRSSTPALSPSLSSSTAESPMLSPLVDPLVATSAQQQQQQQRHQSTAGSSCSQSTNPGKDIPQTMTDSKRKTLASLNAFLASRRQASKNGAQGGVKTRGPPRSPQSGSLRHRKRSHSAASNASASSAESSHQPLTPPDTHAFFADDAAADEPNAKRSKTSGFSGLALLLDAAEA